MGSTFIGTHNANLTALALALFCPSFVLGPHSIYFITFEILKIGDVFLFIKVFRFIVTLI